MQEIRADYRLRYPARLPTKASGMMLTSATLKDIYPRYNACRRQPRDGQCRPCCRKARRLARSLRPQILVIQGVRVDTQPLSYPNLLGHALRLLPSEECGPVSSASGTVVYNSRIAALRIYYFLFLEPPLLPRRSHALSWPPLLQPLLLSLLPLLLLLLLLLMLVLLLFSIWVSLRCAATISEGYGLRQQTFSIPAFHSNM